MVWFEKTETNKGFFVDPLDQPVKTYPALAVAERVTNSPASKLPPDVFTEPPVSAFTVKE